MAGRGCSKSARRDASRDAVLALAASKWAVSWGLTDQQGEHQWTVVLSWPVLSRSRRCADTHIHTHPRRAKADHGPREQLDDAGCWIIEQLLGLLVSHIARPPGSAHASLSRDVRPET